MARQSATAFDADITVPDEAYGSGWNGSLEVPTKNAVYDKMETLATTTTVNTTDATTTTIATIAIPSSTTVMIDANVVARRTGGAAGTAEDAAAYKVAACYKNVSGTATEVGESSIFSAEDQAAWSCTITASSGNALIQITGAASNNVSWSCTYRTYTVSS